MVNLRAASLGNLRRATNDALLNFAATLLGNRERLRELVSSDDLADDIPDDPLFPASNAVERVAIG